MRLVDGVNDYQGRIEFQSNGIWGTICDKYFDNLDAETICRQIGILSEKLVISFYFIIDIVKYRKQNAFYDVIKLEYLQIRTNELFLQLSQLIFNV